MAAGPKIGEQQFLAVVDTRKRALSLLVRRSGLPYLQIAKATNTERRAVKRAADGDTIRYDTAVRIEYYLEWYLSQQKDD